MSSLPTVRDFIAELERQNRALTVREFGRQLNSQRKRAELQATVEKYFDAVRPSFASSAEQGELAGPIDSAMQDLLRETHKRGQTARYKALLNRAREGLIQIDALHLLPTNSRSGMDAADAQLLAALDKTLPSAALSYLQAIEDLKSPDRFSWRGPATDLRECMREVLDHLAQDKAVEAQDGYKREPDARGPTMKQKVRYVLRSRNAGSSEMASVESAAVAVEESIGQFVRSVYTRSSVSTHTATSRAEVLRIKSLVQVVLQELLQLRS
jgi:hypothetical protein